MSKQKRYTAEDFRETADDILKYSGQDEEVIAAMLRQAADAEEELAKAKRPDACPANPTNKMCYLPGEYCCDTVMYLQKENAKLKARLEAVVKECERIMNVPIGQIDNINMQQARYNVAYAILSLARGEGGAE